MNKIVLLLFFYRDGFTMKETTKGDIPFKQPFREYKLYRKIIEIL